MIGQFQVWHKGEDRPATVSEINKLQKDGSLFFNGYNITQNGIMWPKLKDSVCVLPFFEIRKVEPEIKYPVDRVDVGTKVKLHGEYYYYITEKDSLCLRIQAADQSCSGCYGLQEVNQYLESGQWKIVDKE